MRNEIKRFFDFPAHGSRWTWYPVRRAPLPVNWKEEMNQKSSPWWVLVFTLFIVLLGVLAAL